MFLSAVLCYENNEYIEYKEYIEDIKWKVYKRRLQFYAGTAEQSNIPGFI